MLQTGFRPTFTVTLCDVWLVILDHAGQTSGNVDGQCLSVQHVQDGWHWILFISAADAALSG